MLDLTSGIQERLEQQKKAYASLPEDRAWLKAYQALNKTGQIIGMFSYGGAVNHHRCRYIYAYCPAENRHLTYLRTSIDDRPNIYLSEYSHFVQTLPSIIEQDVKTLLFRSDMKTELAKAYRKIISDYFSQYLERAKCAVERMGYLDEMQDDYIEALNSFLRKIDQVFRVFEIPDIVYDFFQSGKDYHHRLSYKGEEVLDYPLHHN